MTDAPSDSQGGSSGLSANTPVFVMPGTSASAPVTAPAPIAGQVPDDELELYRRRPDGSHVISNYQKFGDVKWKEYFKPGRILQILHHATKIPQQNGAFLDLTTEALSARYSQWVHTKSRKMIVVMQFEESCIAIPIFTHHGQGLLHKRQAYRQEFVAIRDDKDPNPSIPQSNHAPLIATSQDQRPYDPDNWMQFSRECYAQFTKPTTIIYGTEVKVMGEMDEANLIRLQSLVCRWSPNAEAEKGFPVLGTGGSGGSKQEERERREKLARGKKKCPTCKGKKCPACGG